MVGAFGFLAMMAGMFGLSSLFEDSDQETNDDPSNEPAGSSESGTETVSGPGLLEAASDWTVDAPQEEMLGIVQIVTQNEAGQTETQVYLATTEVAAQEDGGVILRQLTTLEDAGINDPASLLTFNGTTFEVGNLSTETLTDLPTAFAQPDGEGLNIKEGLIDFGMSLSGGFEGLGQAISESLPSGILVQPDPNEPTSEVIQGSEGNDLLEHNAFWGTGEGTAGSSLAVSGGQTLVGGAGDDTLRVGEEDQAWGGAGADQFEVYPIDGSFGPTIIQDFDASEDQILIHIDPDLMGPLDITANLDSQVSIDLEQPNFGPPETVLSWAGQELLRLPGVHTDITPEIHGLLTEGGAADLGSFSSPIVIIYGSS